MEIKWIMEIEFLSHLPDIKQKICLMQYKKILLVALIMEWVIKGVIKDQEVEAWKEEISSEKENIEAGADLIKDKNIAILKNRVLQ